MSAALVNPSAQVTVETVGDESGFAALRNEWNELLRASDVDCLFLTWEWLHTWWKHLAGNRRLAVLTVREGDLLIGLAPFVVRPPSLSRRRALPVTEFLGNGQVGSDYLDVILRRGFEPEARRSLVARLASARGILEWTQLRGDGCSVEGVAANLIDRGWRYTETRTNVCPFIPLAGMTWESYLATLGSEHRYNFNRKLRKLQRDFAVKFEAITAEEPCPAELAIELHNRRWLARGGSDAFHTPGLVSFHREFSTIALKRGWLRLYVLRLNDQPAACIYGFRYGRVFYFYQSGFDPAFEKHSVGLVSMGLAIQQAIAEGAMEYDLLHGNESYKSHWSQQSRDLCRLELYPPGAMGRISKASMDWERASRKLARRLLVRGAK